MNLLTLASKMCCSCLIENINQIILDLIKKKYVVIVWLKVRTDELFLIH